MSGSVELFTNIDITSKTETYIMSESVELCAQIDMMMIDATQKCRMSGSVELCAQIDMMMIMMQLKIAECQDM